MEMNRIMHFSEIQVGSGMNMSLLLFTSCNRADKWKKVYGTYTISPLPSGISQHAFLMWNKFYSLRQGVVTLGLWSTGFTLCWVRASKILGEKQMNKLLVKGFTCVYTDKFLSVNIISLNPKICPTVECKSFCPITLCLLIFIWSL